MPLFNVSPLVPIAQPVVQQAVEVYYQHLSPWMVGMFVHGSAFKGGFIPGCSDIDLRLYLDKEAFVEGNTLPIERAIAIHRDLACIDPAPFHYIQTYAMLPSLSESDITGRASFIPGSYHTLFGRLPIPEVSREQVLLGDHQTMQRLPHVLHDVCNDLLLQGGGRLERRVRLVCTDVWPTLYSMLSLQDKDPFEVWSKAKTVALERLPADEPLGESIRGFYQHIFRYYNGELSVENALACIQSGVQFLSLVWQWYQIVQKKPSSFQK